MIDIVTRMIGAIRPAIARLELACSPWASWRSPAARAARSRTRWASASARPDEFSVVRARAARHPAGLRPPAAHARGRGVRGRHREDQARADAARGGCATGGDPARGRGSGRGGDSRPAGAARRGRRQQERPEHPRARSPRRTSRWPRSKTRCSSRADAGRRQPSTLGATVDAPAEAQRLQANRAKGEPPTAGDTPAVVERRESPLGALVSKVF